MVNPTTNVPRTNLVSAFQGLQSGRKPTNPENSIGHRERNNMLSRDYHLNDICPLLLWRVGMILPVPQVAQACFAVWPSP
jgi:hypothetical protein